MVWLKSFLLALFFFFLFPASVWADIIVNEFSPSSDPEWIEIYNPEQQTVSLKEVVLFFDSNLNTSQKLSFCENQEIGPQGLRLITRPVKSFWLANNGDSLVLKRGDDVIDSVSYGSGQSLKAPTSSQSANRNSDLTWVVVDGPTPEGDTISFECPTPTSTPEPTNMPTPTSTPTPQPPTPTIRISTPTPKQIIAPSLTPKPTVKIASSSGEVLGELEATLSAFYPYEATGEPEKNESTPSAKNKVLPKIFLIGGLLLLFVSASWLWYTHFK